MTKFTNEGAMPPPATGLPVVDGPGVGVPVVPVVPVPGTPGGAGSKQWSSGLFGCFDDCNLCCLTFWCPCITFGRIAEIVDRGSSSCGTSGALYVLLAAVTGCQWVYSCTYRQKMRAQFQLPDAPCCDCCVHFCCEACALCQEYKELQARGFNPELGWHQFAAQQQQAAGPGVAYPPQQQYMGR